MLQALAKVHKSVADLEKTLAGNKGKVAKAADRWRTGQIFVASHIFLTHSRHRLASLADRVNAISDQVASCTGLL